MRTKKKNIILILRRSAGELDFILPLLYKFKSDTEVITIFNDYNSYKSVLNNKNLHNLWKKKCKKFIIIKKYQRFIFKFLLYLFLAAGLNKIKILKKIQKHLRLKTFDVDHFLEKFHIKKDTVKTIFTTIVNLSNLPFILKHNIPNSKLIKFPESTWLFPEKNQNKELFRLANKKNFNRATNFYEEYTDFYLLTKNANLNYYLDNKSQKKSEQKILNNRYFRYEKWWLKKLKSKPISQKKKYNIVVATGAHSNNFDIEHYEYILESIMQTVVKINNCNVIFKMHPSPFNDEINSLKKILRNYKKDIWKISTNHAVSLASNCNFCISNMSSVCLDFLANKKPVIEFFDANQHSQKTSFAVFNKKKSRWESVFESKNLVYNVKNKNQLSKIIDKILFKRKEINFEKKIHSYNKHILRGASSTQIYQLLNKKL